MDKDVTHSVRIMLVSRDPLKHAKKDVRTCVKTGTRAAHKQSRLWKTADAEHPQGQTSVSRSAQKSTHHTRRTAQNINHFY